MLLILTNSEDATASYLCPILKKASVPYLRLDTDQLIARTAFSYESGAVSLRIDGRWYQANDVCNIWYRRPEKLKDSDLGDSPEAKYTIKEWSESFESFFAHIPKPRWMNHPSANVAASHKLKQLTVATGLGFEIPETLATQDSTIFRRFFEAHRGRVIVKPIGDGYVDRDDGTKEALIYTSRVLQEHLEDLDDLQGCPTLVQQFIQKKCDVRITVVDNEIHPVAIYAIDEDGSQRCDIRRNNMSDVEYRSIAVPPTVSTAIRKLMGYYHLRFAAIDMAVDALGSWYFLEVNPNGQWAWLDLYAGTDIGTAFVAAFGRNTQI